MVNSHDINSSAQSGASISLLKKIAAIFPKKRGAVLRRIYAGLNSDFASLNKQKIQIQGMFTPHGISDLKLSPGEITTLIDSPLTSEKDRKDLITFMKNTETANDMSATSNNEEITYASSKDQEPPPKEHYFYAYKYKPSGLWFTTTLYSTPEEAHDALLEKNPARKKLCCIVI